jgi:flagellar protein FlbT
MALKVELKPGERFILGESVITNDSQRTRLFIEGTTPILREKDILLPENARTPCERIYVVIQTMYLSADPKDQHAAYFDLVKDVVRAAPSTLPYIEAVNNEILTGSLYKALKKTQALIAYERELLDHAKCGTGVR